MHRTKSSLVTLAAAALAAVAVGVAVEAHAKLMKTSPADKATVTKAPASVQLWFNEAIDVKLSKVEVTGPAGKVALGVVHAMEPKQLMGPITGKMADGAYTVDWQTAGDDGHVQKGSFTFTLKQAGSTKPSSTKPKE
ncbi:MAG: copper resistance protein CopC [Acidobacteria bacterium]|nr:copper resistance protein CopC [Acidobacteriota bacterium]